MASTNPLVNANVCVTVWTVVFDVLTVSNETRNETTAEPTADEKTAEG